MAGVRSGNPDGAMLRPRRRQQPPVLRLRLLGGFAAAVGSRDLRLPSSGRRVLALTALHRVPVPRALAAERLWPHLPPRSAYGSLRAALSGLHRAHPHLIRSASDQLALCDPVEVDVHATEDLAHRLLEGAEIDDLAIADSARAAFDRLTLPLLPDYVDDWVLLERERLQDLFLHALEAHASRLAADGDFAFALAAIHAALGVDPVRESAASTLVEIHLAEGNVARAARSYLTFRERLRAVIGAEPSAEFQALVAPLITRH